MNIKRSLVVGVGAAAAVAVGVVGGVLLGGVVERPAVTVGGVGERGAPVVECVDESSMDCVWDAGVRGNGVGVSFVNVGGVVIHVPSVPVGGFKYCVDEDGWDCVWDAGVQGNGVGESFVNVGGDVFRVE